LGKNVRVTITFALDSSYNTTIVWNGLGATPVITASSDGTNSNNHQNFPFTYAPTYVCDSISSYYLCVRNYKNETSAFISSSNLKTDDDYNSACEAPEVNAAFSNTIAFSVLAASIAFVLTIFCVTCCVTGCAVFATIKK